MAKSLTFKLRLNQHERKLIKAVADQLGRSQGDTVRFLVKKAANDLGLNLENTAQDVQQHKGAKDEGH